MVRPRCNISMAGHIAKSEPHKNARLAQQQGNHSREFLQAAEIRVQTQRNVGFFPLPCPRPSSLNLAVEMQVPSLPYLRLETKYFVANCGEKGQGNQRNDRRIHR